VNSRFPRFEWWTGRRTYARQLVASIALAALALTAVLSGQQYFYCRAMGAIMRDRGCACAQVERHEQGGAAVGVPFDCFELRALGRVASFTVGPDFAVPAAPLTALVAAPPAPLVPANAISSVADHPIRAGPYSPSALRAQLMVFLI
jgi:hypothetical protein